MKYTFGFFVFFIFGCGSQDAQKNKQTEMKTGLNGASVKLVATADDLFECNDSSLNALVYLAEENKFYSCLDIGWEEVDAGELKGYPGEIGEAGAAGPDGSGFTIEWKGSLESQPVNPSEGWAYFNTADQIGYKFLDGEWVVWFKAADNGVDLIGPTVPEGADLDCTYDSNKQLLTIEVSDAAEGDGELFYEHWHYNGGSTLGSSLPSLPTDIDEVYEDGALVVSGGASVILTTGAPASNGEFDVNAAVLGAENGAPSWIAVLVSDLYGNKAMYPALYINTDNCELTGGV